MFVEISQRALEALQQSIDDMEAWRKTYLDDHGEIKPEHYQAYDEGMTDWRYDIAEAAESLVGTIAPLGERYSVKDNKTGERIA